MTNHETDRTEDADALRSRLALIENQPLDQRAENYTHVHDALQATLEGADSPRPSV